MSGQRCWKRRTGLHVAACGTSLERKPECRGSQPSGLYILAAALRHPNPAIAVDCRTSSGISESIAGHASTSGGYVSRGCTHRQSSMAMAKHRAPGLESSPGTIQTPVSDSGYSPPIVFDGGWLEKSRRRVGKHWAPIPANPAWGGRSERSPSAGPREQSRVTRALPAASATPGHRSVATAHRRAPEF